MKLIMERFRKNLNEMPAGLGMGLKVGAATAAGKADAAQKAIEDKKEEERQSLAAANFQFTMKLEGLGREPQYIEIEPGDIKGIDYPDLVRIINSIPSATERSQYFPYGRMFKLKDGKIVLMACDDFYEPGTGDGYAGFCNYPSKISGTELSEILRNALEPKGLWMQLYRQRTD